GISAPLDLTCEFGHLSTLSWCKYIQLQLSDLRVSENPQVGEGLSTRCTHSEQEWRAKMHTKSTHCPQSVWITPGSRWARALQRRLEGRVHRSRASGSVVDLDS